MKNSDIEFELLSEYLKYYIKCLGISIGGCFEDIETTISADGIVTTNASLLFCDNDILSFDEWKLTLNSAIVFKKDKDAFDCQANFERWQKTQFNASYTHIG